MIYSAAALSLVLALNAASGAIVDPAIHRALSTSEPVNVFVQMKEGTDAILNNINQQYFNDRGQRITAMRAALMENAAASQQSVMDLLTESTTFSTYANNAESFWISNELYLPNITPELLTALEALDTVESIHKEHIITLDPIMEDEPFEALNRTTRDQVEWGIAKVAAPQVWETGNTGAGVLVGIIDTGVRGTHEAVREAYIGNENNGWLDPYSYSDNPHDTNGHGTHVMGTILGQNGIGVAPGAKWLACRGCGAWSCTERALKMCGQYITCPTDTRGANADCSRAPHISSNSWGGRANDPWYKPIVRSWLAAGIVPVFAQGNSGPRCSSANSPGDYEEVIGVGASTKQDTLARFSSVGPAVGTQLMKPDVSAPGQQIRSAWINSDSSYNTISGTSMACPHTAGVIALMLSHTESNLQYDEMKTALTLSASTDVTGPGRTCGGATEDDFPNNAFGYGVIHAQKAIESIRN